MTGRQDHNSEGRLWKVIRDPSGIFTGNLFRRIDLEAGGFDPGMAFEHIRTRERRIVDMNGTARKSKSNDKIPASRRSTSPAVSRAKTASGALRAARNTHR